jgi:hypothetical protein
MDSDDLKSGKLSWQAPKRLSLSSYPKDDFLDLFDFPNIIYSRYLQILKGGLYLVLFDAIASLQGIG